MARKKQLPEIPVPAMPDPETVWRYVHAGHLDQPTVDDVRHDAGHPTLDDVAAFISYIAMALSSLPPAARGNVECEWSFPNGLFLMWTPIDLDTLGLEVLWEEEDEDPRQVFGLPRDFEEGWAEDIKAWERGEVEYLYAGVRDPRGRHGHLAGLGMISLFVSPTGKKKKQQDEYRSEIEGELIDEALGALIRDHANGGDPVPVELLDYIEDEADDVITLERFVWVTAAGMLVCGGDTSNRRDVRASGRYGPVQEPAYVSHYLMPREVWDDVVAGGQWTYPLGKDGGVLKRTQSSLKNRPRPTPQPWYFIGAPHPAYMRDDGTIDKEMMGYWLRKEWRRRLKLDVQENPSERVHVPRWGVNPNIRARPFESAAERLREAQTPVTKERALEMMRRWKRTYPDVQRYFDSVKDRVK